MLSRPAALPPRDSCVFLNWTPHPGPLSRWSLHPGALLCPGLLGELLFNLSAAAPLPFPGPAPSLAPSSGWQLGVTARVRTEGVLSVRGPSSPFPRPEGRDAGSGGLFLWVPHCQPRGTQARAEKEGGVPPRWGGVGRYLSPCCLQARLPPLPPRPPHRRSLRARRPGRHPRPPAPALSLAAQGRL